jgi:predicted O-linked N-acetylglucosamine transferase (SPINDLY family)
MGIESLIATNAEEYAAIATRLGVEADYRQSICEEIAQKNEHIFAPEKTLRNYEQFFESAIYSN